MKFVMSKQLCIPKTQADVHRELVKKPDLGRSVYEQLGPDNKYRDEYFETYKLKCEEFRMKGKAIRDENIKALFNTKEKLGEVYKYKLEGEDGGNETKTNTSEVKLTSLTSISLAPVRENGETIRKRHERNYKDSWDVNKDQCYFEPWFRRYLILCRFISAVRKIILKNRMLKRLEILKKLKHDEDIIKEYESQYITCKHLMYPSIFKKFTEQKNDISKNVSVME